MKKIHVILDTDTYNEADDQFALSYLIRSQDRVVIDAVTVAPYSIPSRGVTVPEGMELSYHEVLNICRLCGYDCAGKVFRGASDYMENGCYADNDAVKAISRIANENEKTVILAIGAITNLGLAFQKDPALAGKTEVIWLGGNSPETGHNREFNFRQDPAAVRAVLESGVKLTVLPCLGVIDALRIPIVELKSRLGGKSPLCDYLIGHFCDTGLEGANQSRVIWDISAVAYLLSPEWFETVDRPCPSVEADTSYRFPQTGRPVTFAKKVDRAAVYADLFEKLVRI